MTRFSEIARDIESQYDPDFDLDASKTAPPVRYIEYRLLELCKMLDARLTALEVRPQAPEPMSQLRLLADANGRLEADMALARDTIAMLNRQRNNLAAQVDDLRNINAALRKDNARLTDEREAAKREIAELLQSNANLDVLANALLRSAARYGQHLSHPMPQRKPARPH